MKTYKARSVNIQSAALLQVRGDIESALWAVSADGAKEAQISRYDWIGDYDESFQIRTLRWLRFCWAGQLEDSLNPLPIKIRTITHIVASWRLTQLRLRAILPYLTLCAQRALLCAAIDQLDRLARSDYLESWINTTK
jgi:hypothetical protein